MDQKTLGDLDDNEENILIQFFLDTPDPSISDVRQISARLNLKVDEVCKFLKLNGFKLNEDRGMQVFSKDEPGAKRQRMDYGEGPSNRMPLAYLPPFDPNERPIRSMPDMLKEELYLPDNIKQMLRKREHITAEIQRVQQEKDTVIRDFQRANRSIEMSADNIVKQKQHNLSLERSIKHIQEQIGYVRSQLNDAEQKVATLEPIYSANTQKLRDLESSLQQHKSRSHEPFDAKTTEHYESIATKNQTIQNLNKELIKQQEQIRELEDESFKKNEPSLRLNETRVRVRQETKKCISETEAARVQRDQLQQQILRESELNKRASLIKVTEQNITKIKEMRKRIDNLRSENQWMKETVSAVKPVADVHGQAFVRQKTNLLKSETKAALVQKDQVQHQILKESVLNKRVSLIEVNEQLAENEEMRKQIEQLERENKRLKEALKKNADGHKPNRQNEQK